MRCHVRRTVKQSHINDRREYRDFGCQVRRTVKQSHINDRREYRDFGCVMSFAANDVTLYYGRDYQQIL